MKHRLQALQAFLGRYAKTFKAAWAVRASLDPPRRSADEVAFLPAHLELVETPASPTARWTMRLIMALFCIALLWAVLGRFDIVAAAPGKTVASGRTRVVQPLESAVVRRIRVQDGQAVKQGQPLIELDATATGADASKAGEALANARIAQARYTAVLAALAQGTLPDTATDDLTASQHVSANDLAQGDFSQFQAQQRSLQAEQAQRQAEARTAQSQIAPMQASLRIARERVADLKQLLGSHYVSRHEYLAREQEKVELERALAAQQARLRETAAAIASAQEQLRVLTASTRQKALDGLQQAREQIDQYAPEVRKTRQRDELMVLKAPVDGTVQQLAVHTVGGVVTPAQALLAVVPTDEPLEVEATVLNKDIGFVRVGQRTIVKIESFPYTRYGYLEGTVTSVSHDAAQDEKLGLVFPARIQLDRDSLHIDGVEIHLTPGMSVSAEIKTGRRRVISYLLDPLQTHLDDAGRER